MTSLEAENPIVYAGFRSLSLAIKVDMCGQFAVGGKNPGVKSLVASKCERSDIINIRWLLRMIVKKGFGLFCACYRLSVWGNLHRNCENLFSASYSRLGSATGR